MALFSKKPDKAAQPAPSAAAPAAPAPDGAAGAQRAARADGAAEQPMIASGGGTASLGEIISLMTRSAHFRAMPLGVIATLLRPAFANGQFMIVRTTSSAGAKTAVGACLWASVSAEVDARLSQAPDQPMQLSAAEWKSGDIVWVVAALGESRVVGPMLRRLQNDVLGGRPMKLRARGADGAAAIRTLTPDGKFEGAAT
jgi:hemolysin-activating ACP:hemolysin acyltransferase